MTHHTIHPTLRPRLLAALAVFALVLLAGPALAATGVVNINTASADQLSMLPRIGPAIAQRIVDHRDENGKFSDPEDLMLVRGIGEKTFDLIAPWITVDGDTTLSGKVTNAEARERLADGADRADQPAGDQG